MMHHKPFNIYDLRFQGIHALRAGRQCGADESKQ